VFFVLCLLVISSGKSDTKSGLTTPFMGGDKAKAFHAKDFHAFISQGIKGVSVIGFGMTYINQNLDFVQ